jgi:hypothetical protein
LFWLIDGTHFLAYFSKGPRDRHPVYLSNAVHVPTHSPLKEVIKFTKNFSKGENPAKIDRGVTISMTNQPILTFKNENFAANLN